MTRGKELDTIFWLPDMSDEANDAVSPYTQVKMSDASRLLKLTKAECPTVWIRRLPKHGDNIDDPMVPLERNINGHPLAGLLWEGRLDEVLLQEGWQKRTQLGMSSCSPTSSTLVISTRRRHKNDRTKSQLSSFVVQTEPKMCDLENRTPLVVQVYLGCTQRGSVTKKENVKSKRDLFFSRRLRRPTGRSIPKPRK